MKTAWACKRASKKSEHGLPSPCAGRAACLPFPSQRAGCPLAAQPRMAVFRRAADFLDTLLIPPRRRLGFGRVCKLSGTGGATQNQGAGAPPPRVSSIARLRRSAAQRRLEDRGGGAPAPCQRCLALVCKHALNSAMERVTQRRKDTAAGPISLRSVCSPNGGEPFAPSTPARSPSALRLCVSHPIHGLGLDLARRFRSGPERRGGG